MQREIQRPPPWPSACLPSGLSVCLSSGIGMYSGWKAYPSPIEPPLPAFWTPVRRVPVGLLLDSVAA